MNEATSLGSFPFNSKTLVTLPTINSTAARIALFLVVVLSLLIAPQQAEARRVVRAGVYNFKPLVYSDPTGVPQGFFVTMLNQVAQREDWEVQYVHSTWQGAMDNLKAEKIDLILCVGYTEARAEFLDFPEEFLVLDWGLVYKAKGSSIDTIMDLEGKTVAGLRGSVYSAGFLDLVKQFQIKVNFVEMDQITDVFQAVESGRADAGITSNIPGILNEASHSVERTPIIFTPVKLGFAVNQGTNADLIEALDRNIAEMKADRSSSYHHELERLFAGKATPIPEEVYWAFAGVCGVLLLAVSFIVTLRRKVRLKTAELKQQANLLEAIINGTTDAVFIKDTRGRYLVVNDEVVRLFGRPRSEILGWDDTRFFPPDEAHFLMAVDRAVMATHEVRTEEEHITTLDQARVYLATKGPIYDKSGLLSGMFGISRDITDLKQAQNELHRYSQLLRRTGEIALVGGWEYDLATRKLFWSEMVCQIHEVAADIDITLEAAMAFYGTAARRKILGAIDLLMQSGTAFDLELPALTAKRSSIWVRIRGEAEYCDGKVVKLFGSVQNITGRKQMEERLRQSNEQLQFVLEGSQLGTWDWNMETGEVACSERWDEMLGYTLEQVDGSVQAWASLVHPEDYERAWKGVEDHLEGRTPVYQAEYRMLTKSGEYKWILDQARIVQRDANGRPMRMSGTHADITERKRAEEEKQLLEQQMHHAQRLESLGVLTGGIAHDFNNILAVILGHCCLAQMDAERVQGSLAEIEVAAERAADLCRQMLAYAGKAQFVLARLNFRELVEEMAKMLKPTISQKVSIKVRSAGEIPAIYGDASQLSQIVMNLVINASEAIGKEQGEILITIAETPLAEGRERDHLGKAIAAGCYVCLEVSDNGCGMNEETRRRIFEPFYTTKFTGRGLGMSAVLGIIVAHHGALQFSSQPGRGTTFKVYLPAGDAEVQGPGHHLEQPDASAPWLCHGTVLLAEDEEQIRLIARVMLENFGFVVLEAANGQEALQLYRQHRSEIVMVVTDMGMPVMDGYELVLELKKIAPALPIVVTSGFGDAEVSSRIPQEEIAGLIGKPYHLNQFRDVLMSVAPRFATAALRQPQGARERAT